ncbi:porin [Rhodoferax saidenbachensis]|uniref:Porin domain-containing protein n=2 Tax=Rhodoferax saidenbachensis TaxID=1484693 RepID=A0A1P8K765_9BURK|nr:porin [Rhodoferax saidenbachensis]APW41801.1 hypothetical protein RS694_04060 [Rhodoferax saidenbachensis]
MKKTLVAMAVLAASGASFAQATISGTVAMGWANTKNATGGESGGLGVDTTVVNFTASEDLGGGLKATAKLGLDGATRGTIGGGDTTLALSSSAFTFTLGATQLANYLQGGIANQSGAFNGFEGRLFDSKSVGTDWASLAVPVGPVTLSLSFYEGGNNQATPTVGGLGLGQGSGGVAANNPSRNTQYQIAYASGPLAANAAFKAYDSSASGGVYSTKSIVRGSVSYDFGVAKVGAGIAQSQLVVAGTETQSMLSVGVPFGAVTVGALVANRVFSGTGNTASGGTIAADDYNQTGYGLELDYALSKQTSVAVNYLSYQQGSGNKDGATRYGPGAANNSSTIFEVALVKSF